MDANEFIQNVFNGDVLVTWLEHTLEDQFHSFNEARATYEMALDVLRQTIGKGSVPSVNDVADAVRRQTASNLLFAGALGLKSNWEHFHDPLAPTVLDLDFDVFLREQDAIMLPEYQHAQEVLSRFCGLLSPVQQELYDPVIEYISYLETVGPKLAHLYGHLLGDVILGRFVPGYEPDTVLSDRYRKMVAGYLCEDEVKLSI